MFKVEPLPSDLIELDAVVDGETEDVLAPEVVEWLECNCKAEWMFKQHIGEPDQPGLDDAECGRPLTYSVDFSDANDALMFKLRWF